MPSPTIPRSTSDPFLSSSSSSSSRNRLPPSSHSACFSKSAMWLARNNISKLGSFIIPGRKSIDSPSKHSDLTEESLEAHNRRHEAIIINSIIAEDRNAKCSPYYKGLVDSTLVVNRERHNLSSSSSPGRDSHATNVTSSSSLSSFILKMHGWSSCLSPSFKSSSSSKQKDNKSNINIATAASATKQITRPNSSCSLSSCSVLSLPTQTRMTLARNEGDNNSLSVVNEEKPLRERVSELKTPSSSAAAALPPPPTQPKRDDYDGMKVMENEFTWANKYQPKALKDFICNRDKAIQLQGLMRDIDCNHFIFEGPAGVGKRTMIRAMLLEAFGPDRMRTREEWRTFILKGEPIDSIKVRVNVSHQHVELSLSDVKGYEKHVIVELIKETYNRISESNECLKSKFDNCRAIILYDADKLSQDGLLYIKWLLERYKGFSKFFFCCCDVSKLQPIKTLCSLVQLLPPSSKEIVEVLEFISKQEGIDLPHPLAEKISNTSKNNLRQAIRSFEASWKRSFPFTEDQVVLTGWEDDFINIAKNMVEEQSPKQLYIIRGKLQNLIEHDLSIGFIFQSLVEELKKLVNEPFQLQIDVLYKKYDSGKSGNMLDGEDYQRSRHEEAGKRLNDPSCKRKFDNITIIEEFIARFMSFYKSSSSNNKSIHPPLHTVDVDHT